MRAVEVGFDVVGFDIDGVRIKRLAAGESHVEDVTSSDVARALATGRYEPTDDPERTRGFDVAVIDVPTPLTEGAPNLSHVTDSARMLADVAPVRSDRHPRVDDISGHDRRPGGRHPRRGLRAGGGA